MKKEVTHYEEIMSSGYASDRWKECYMANFRDYGYEGPEAYVQATIDYLRTKGYQVVSKENKDVDSK